MVSTSAQAYANTVIGGWVGRFATPAIITSNRGPQFTSAVWTVLCHRQLKETLRPRNCDADGPASNLHLFALLPLTGAGGPCTDGTARARPIEMSLGSDPLPGTTPCQRIFWGAPVETGILHVFVVV
jgi:hypothetical protein